MPDPEGEPAPERGGAHTYDGPVRWGYRPEIDREADPGEIVWTWVAFEEDARVGKDRPVAVIGHADDGRLAALMLSSRDRSGEHGWMSIGSGPWDREGRESWVRVDRVLAVHLDAVRREGAIIPRQVFESIVVTMGGTVPSAGVSPGHGPSTRGRIGILARLLRRRS